MLTKTSFCSIMECAMVVFALLKMSCLVCANQGEPGITEQSVVEKPIPFTVSSNVLGLVKSTVSWNVHPVKSTLEATSSILQPFSHTPRTSVTSVYTPAIKQSQAQTTSLALTHTSESGAVALTSLPLVSTVLIKYQNQSASHVASSQAGSSSQASAETTSQKKDVLFSTLHLSPSWSVGLGSMTTKASLSSSIPMKPSLSTTGVFAYSPVAKSSISPSGLAGHSSSDLMTSSMLVHKANASMSQTMIHPTTMSSLNVQTSRYQSSSALPLPPTTSTPPGYPDPPVIQDTSVLSANSVLLNWNATTGQFIANFSVELSVDSVAWEQATCNLSLVQGACVVKQKQAVISSLAPYTNYTFRIVARSQFGRSNYSAESKWVVTDEAAPSDAPVITAAYSISSQDIFVAWQPPKTLNGKLRKYEIYVKKVTPTQPTTLPTSNIAPTYSVHSAGPSATMPSATSSSSSSMSVPSILTPTTPGGGFPLTEPFEPTEEPEEWRKLQHGSPVVIDAGLVLNYTVGNLDKWTSYEMKLHAVTVAPGPFSDKVIVRTDEDVPSQPRQVLAKAVNSSAIYVNWTKPAETNGLLLMYQVTYSEKDSLVSSKISVRQDITSVILTPLKPFTLYVIQVSASTSKGESHTTVHERTDEGRPSAPQGLSTQSVNSTAILVSWKTPVNPNGQIKFRLSFNKRSETSVASKLVYDGNGTQYLVSNLKPYTQYTFRVVAYNVKYNLLSSSIDAIETTAQAAPSGSPKNVRAITNSSSSIIIYWMPPKADEQNGDITSYNIKLSSNDPTQARNVSTMTNATTLRITGLQAYTNYSFVVQAVNKGGIGPYSILVANRTFEAEPSSPRNFTAKSVNSTTIKVTWVKALYPNGVIHYRLYMRVSNDDQLVYEGMDTGYVLSGLEEYVKYTFTVVSFNSKYNWTSKPVVAVETTHPAEPTGPPQDVHALTLSSTSIQVRWKPPLPSERNGIIIRYTVHYRSQSGQPQTLDTADNSTSIEVKNLTIFMEYWFKVNALNEIGAGPESEPVFSTTFEDRPSPPVDVVAKTVNSTAIKVTWKMPLNPNGEIFYRLYYWQSSKGVGTKRLAYDGPLLEHIVTGLHEYVTYTFMLQAYNVKYSWSSAATNATETTHPAAPSGPPLNVMALTMSSTSILVKWSPPNELYRNGVITHYFVKYSSLSHEASINTTDNNTQALVIGLGKYTTYYFTVQAVNNIGVGPASVDDAKNTTFEDLPGEPVILSVNRKTNSLELTWKMPTEPNGIIKSFRLCWSLVVVHNQSCIDFNGAANWYKIPNLKAFSEYSVSLAASTSVGRGPPITNVYKTDEGVPSEPQGLQAWNTSEYSIFVTWKKPAIMNGNLIRYQVFNRLATGTDQPIPKDAGLRTNFTLSRLEPYTRYYVAVQAFTGAGGGAKSNVEVVTDESEPTAVMEVIIPADKITSHSIEVTWLPPHKPNGKIGYYFNYWEFSAGPSTAKRFVLPGNTRTKLVGGLKPFTYYIFSVVPYNLRKNLSGPSFSQKGQTKAAVPSGPPRNVVINSTTSTSFTLFWDPPLEPNGIIQGYDVMYYECNDQNKKNILDNVKDRVYTIRELQPWQCYRIHVACQSSGGLGPFSDYVQRRTDAGAPPPLGTLAPPDKETIESFSFQVELTEASNEKGVVSYYQVIVRELATDNTDQPVRAPDPDYYKADDLYTYEEARKMKPQLVPYVAAEFSAREFDHYKGFVVGSGERTLAADISSRRRRREVGTTEFYNGPLEENTFYAVFQRAYVSKNVYTSSSWIEPVETAAATSPTKQPESSTNIGLIVGVVLVLIIIPILLATVYFIRRKRQNSGLPDDRDDFSNGHPMRMKKMSRKRRSLQKRLMGSTESLDALDELAASRARRHPVPIDDFERHVDRMHMDGDHGFSEEYMLVQPDDEFSFQQFLNPANKYKNRYANIVAYDHTRVLLNPIEGVAGSDYINANFLDGYNRQRAYIAAQGPLMETFDDFWRMIWEQMSSVIVMLTKLEERGRRKCDQYWPERGTRNYGQIQVTLKETLNMSHYTVRKFVMTHKLYPDDERTVKQFHFTAWPDHGVPSHPTPLLSLVRHTFTCNRESIGPMVVHCSAGVGRTGTFVTLDVMLQRISQEDSVDVFGFVRQMRYQRNFMVQTEAQYVFIHDALLEAISCGVTEVEAKDLGARIRELRQVDPETGYTYLENEFCRLAKEEHHPIAFKSASLNCNSTKNRYANILPFESTRVHLKMRPGEMGSDYINANFVDGYCQPRAYIATQAPVPDTFEDFWRLVWEQESAAVVMLTREEEAGKVKCHHYWPSEGSRLYGVILVELLEEASFGDYISRKFKLTHTEDKDSRTVNQFQYTDWPDIGLPDSGVGIVDLIGQVQKWQQQSGNTAIVIHCSGGVGRTGVFCGISMMIERLKAEGVIDVFQTVQAMRLQRPAMVQTAEQYEFCYTTLQEYLDSFDLYANFQ